MKKRYILRVMRLLILFLLAGFMHVAAAGYSQSITLTGKDIPFVDALGAIREQGGYAVTADKTLLKQAKPVTVDATAMPVEQFLTVILTNQPLEATIE